MKIVNPYAKNRICGVCGKKELIFPHNITVCPDCFRQIKNSGRNFMVIGRNIMGGFCDIHGKMRFNTSTVNLSACKDCIELTVRRNRDYDDQRAKYLSKVQSILNIGDRTHA